MNTELQNSIITTLGTDISCDDLANVFTNVDLADLSNLNLPDLDLSQLPKPDLSKVKLDVNLKLKFDDMFKNVSLDFPDIDIGDLEFNLENFNKLADILQLPDMSKISEQILNPLSDIIDKIGIPDIPNDILEDLIKKLPDCDTFKKKLSQAATDINQII